LSGSDGRGYGIQILPANLHILPAETSLDAEIAVRDAVIKRRRDSNDLAILLVDREIAAHAAVRADGVRLSLTPFVPGAGLAHVEFAFEH